MLKIGPPGGHIDQMMRETRNHHYQLSALADRKAAMLLSVSAIVVPLTLRYLDDPILRYPAMTMILFCVLTIAQVAYASMPRIFRAKPPDPSSRLFNPMFFGDFAHLDYDEYLTHWETILSDPAHTYEAQVREVYVLGKYLAGHKYKYLRRGYLMFIAGSLISCLVWVVMMIIAWYQQW